MGTWSVVNNELNDILKFSCLVGKTLHDVSDEHAHDFLSLDMSSFHEALFHRAPRGAKTATNSDHCGILLHQHVFKFRAAVRAQHPRDGAATENAACKHASGLDRVTFRRAIGEDTAA